MCWIKKIKRPVMIVIVFITSVILLCLLQYGVQFYFNPIKKDIDFNAAGVLVYCTEPVSYEAVNAKLKGKTLHYLYKDEEDGVQGNVWLNGNGLFGYGGADDIGFYLEFHGDPEYACAQIMGNETPGNMFTTSRDLKTFICGVSVTEDTDDKTDQQAKTQALLVIPAEEIDTANAIIREAASSSLQFADWLSENGWSQYLE